MRHDLVREMVIHYARHAGVEKMPRVFTRPEQFEKYIARRGGLTRAERGHLRRGYAITALRKQTRCEVYVNPAMHAHIADLDDTAAHEAAHIRWPSLSHGALFARRMKALMAGQRCPPRGHRLPDAFR